MSIAKSKNAKQVELSSDECIELYNLLIDLLNKEIYNYSPSDIISRLLQEQIDNFVNASMIFKIKVLNNLLNYLKCNERKNIDLTLLTGKSAMGVLMINKNLRPCKIIAESITGFYTKVIWEIK